MTTPIVISAAHIKQGFPKRIGRLKGCPVYHILSKGGYSIIAVKDGNKINAIGCGNHVAVSKAVAMENEPEVEFDELSKSEDLPLASYQHLLPFWREFTQKFIMDFNA